MAAGSTNLPALPRLMAGQSVGGMDEVFCSALEGVVTFAAPGDDGALGLELSSGRGKAEVRLPAGFAMDPQDLMGARLRATGIGQAVFSAEGYKVAGQLTVDSDEGLEILDFPRDAWDSCKITTVQQAVLAAATNRQPHLVRLRGVVGAEGSTLVFRDQTGLVELLNGGAVNLEPGSPGEVLGLCEPSGRRPGLKYFALRQIPLAAGNADGLPLLTTVREVKQMSRTEAKRSYPVKVRGVITFVWPNAGFFLEDTTWSIDVRLATNALSVSPRVGEYWEVEGQTFAEFAPDILATNLTRLGLGTMPEPGHPNPVQLVDGSMDTQYIELEGVALGADGTALSLLTRGGRLSVRLPELSHDLLARFQGARIRVRGCVIPGRDVNTEQVKLGEFELRNASVAVDEPAPADPFAIPLEHVTDLLLFESHASPIQRARIGGVVLAQRRNQLFLLDQSNGVRAVADAAPDLQPGDRIEAVGFPDLTGPAPVLNDAIVRRLDHLALPEPARLEADHLLSGAYDSTRVTIESTLEAQRMVGGEQVLELRAGPRLWMARMPAAAGLLPEIPLGSELSLTGVYAGEGGDRLSGRDIESFELLMNSPGGLLVLSRPSWWTARHALAVAGVLLAVLGLAAIWIWALRRQVEERTRALKSEIEDHKRTEVELEKKTLLLTREIEERRRIEAEVERGHKQLLVTSRLAGMAEVATSVLHNVGNVMTSVNVLSTSLVELVRDSKIASVARLGDLLRKNRHELDRFVRDDERGRNIPEYVGQLGEHLTNEQSLLLQKVKTLNENIHHINEIVAMQQNYAQVSGVLETLPPEEVVEDSLRMHGESLKRHGIKLERHYARLPALTMDRHKILQILFNLLENAKYACLQGGAADKKIAVRLEQTAAGFIRMTVTDNGMGIAAENLSRIFAQGFSTRRDGHGFGLHSSILAAQDMGGTLTAHSDGAGRGATFVLEIPMKRAGTAATQH
jgi:signal transduction histidine kinase